MKYILALLLTLVPVYAQETIYQSKDWGTAQITKINPQPTNLIISNGKKALITINLSTGKVTLAEDLELDQASKEFWKIVEKTIPTCMNTVEYK